MTPFDMEYHAREMRPLLERLLKQTPVVVLSGLRQSGKSTSLRHEPVLAEGRRYLTLDNLDVADQAQREPWQLVNSASKLALDEIQRAPGLFLPVKRAVDEDRRAGRFVLSGSANLLLLEKVADSLAGRSFYLTMHPLNRRERLGRLDHPPAIVRFLADGAWPTLDMPPLDEAEVLRGGFPELALNPELEAGVWFEGYEKTYLERDVSSLRRIEDLAGFRRLTRLAALRLGGVLNLSGLARDVQLPATTVTRHLDLLEAMCLIRRVPPFLGNRSKRLIKSPKLYFADSGLAAHLAGVTEVGTSSAEPLRGALLENFVLQNLMAALEPHLIGVRFYFWHEQGRQEVDFVIEHGRKLVAVEVKATGRLDMDDTRSLRDFVRRTPDCVAGVLTYFGQEVMSLGEKLWAVPLHGLLG